MSTTDELFYELPLALHKKNKPQELAYLNVTKEGTQIVLKYTNVLEQDIVKVYGNSMEIVFEAALFQLEEPDFRQKYTLIYT